MTSPLGSRRGCRSPRWLLVVVSVLASTGLMAADAKAPGLKKPRIEVHKRQRALVLFDGDQVVARFPIGLGFRPAGPKRREGDGATPEGRYKVCIKNPQSRYYLSLGLNYPNRQDAARGLARRLISEAEAAAIVDAERAGICPPWNTALGGEIFIHGRGSSEDWTLGCIALDDPEMRTLFEVSSVGTPVEIKP